MKKRIGRIVLGTVLCLLLICVFASCGSWGGNSYNGTYYAYKNGVKQSGDWIKLDKDKWSDDGGDSGRLEEKNGVLYLYLIIFGEEDVFCYGTVKDGVFSWTTSGAYYRNYYADSSKAANKDSSATEKGNSNENPIVTPTDNNNGNGGKTQTVTEYADAYVTFKPAKQGKKQDSGYSYYNNSYSSLINTYLYIELTSDDLGGPNRIGKQNNLDLARDSAFDFSVADGYLISWYESDFNTPNGAQVFTLDYGSNIQYVTIWQNQKVVKRYLVDIYVKYDYYVNLFTSIYADSPYTRVRVVENELFPAQTEVKSVADFEYKERVYRSPITNSYVPFNYNTKIRSDWNLYQTYQPRIMEVDLDGGTMSEVMAVSPYTKKTTYPIPTKDGYDFIGWQTEDGLYFTDINGFSASMMLTSENNFSALKADYRIKQYQKIEEETELSTSVSWAKTIPVVTYTDQTQTVINTIEYFPYSETKAIDPCDIYFPANSEKAFINWNCYNSDGNIEQLRSNSYANKPYALFANLENASYGDNAMCSITLNEEKAFSSSVINRTLRTYLPTNKSYTLLLRTESGSFKFTVKKYEDNEEQTYTVTSSSPVTITLKLNMVSAGWISFYVPECGYPFTAKLSGATADYNEATDGAKTEDDLYSVGEDVVAETKIGYTWLGWYDGETKISEGTSMGYTLAKGMEKKNFTEKWQVWEEMQNFYFISTKETCTITGVKNKTTTEILVPDYVTSIGEYAFSGCSSLTNITIGNGVTSIGGGAFYDCPITTATIPAIACTYINNSALQSVTITSGTSIPGNAFSNCTKLTSITIPDSITSIGEEAFYGCYQLVEIYNKSALSITKGSTYNGYIGCYAKAVYTKPYTSKVSTDENGYILYTDEDEVSLIGYAETDTELTLPSNVTEINQYAFYENDRITSVTLPDSVTSIGNRAFYNCSGLTSITIPGSVTNIEDETFSGCSGLTSIMIGNSVTSIGNYAFYNCNSLTSITIPNSVTSIGSGAFDDCPIATATIPAIACTYINNSALQSVTITSGTSIPGNAFSNCTKLTSITIPDSITSIGGGAFSGCSSLRSITIPFVGAVAGKTSRDTYQYPFGYIFGTSKYTGGTETTQYYYGSSMTDTTYTTYYIPSTLKSVTVTGGNILYGAFYNCSNLVIVTLPDSVTRIESYAFSSCTSLTSITIPNSVTSIKNHAFHGCTSLPSITIPDSVTSIGEGAFSGCSSLQSITIPFVGEQAGKTSSDTYYPFGYIFGTGNYTGGVETKQYYNSSGNYSTFYIPASLRRVTVTGGNILYGAFSNCKSLTSITIGNSVRSIGDYAFSKCWKLISITIGNSVRSIGEYAFDDCSSLTSITIGNSVRSIGEYAFFDCSSLTSITIPDSVTSIGGHAFSSCTSLTSITIPDSVTFIALYEFSWCGNLTSITIGSGVTFIRSYAFYNCTGLMSITFQGTMEQWNAIAKDGSWNENTGSYTIHCTNGDIRK